MRPVAFQSVVVTSQPGQLPLASVQGSARPSSLLRLALVALLAAHVLLPQLWLAGTALTDPAFRTEIMARPLVAFELCVALAFWTALFVWPLNTLFRHVTRGRHVEVDAKQVTVRDQRSSGATLWREPVDSYLGIAHHVRTSLSGIRHEMILVHPDHTRTVLLSASEHISETEFQATLDLLAMPPVTAAAIYGFGTSKTPKTVTPGPINSVPMAA